MSVFTPWQSEFRETTQVLLRWCKLESIAMLEVGQEGVVRGGRKKALGWMRNKVING